ncbi:hypothetical protein [Leptolyngbya sp. FACHB-671]|uniref:hypothetical protein n=1 Tax=Leptolyngbya sp. FACHB-671 TaxID=2692812 RepID=UPI001F550010|nr:hypothetical protein [Leptolyngbya sp. FACHB-671]
MNQPQLDPTQPPNLQTSRQTAANQQAELVLRISPLIRLTLTLLYLALTLPLPFLAQVTASPVPPQLLIIGLVIGWLGLYVALSEGVILNDQGIQVAYPGWVPNFWRKGWSLPWSEVKALKPRSTGQGGLVYYFLSQSGEAYLLPMRVAGFAKLVERVQAETGIDTTDVRPLAQPWMYLILLVSTLLLLIVDGWTIWTALLQGNLI